MEWFARENFWEEMYPFLFPPERFQRAGEEAELILELSTKKEGRLLDLACGPGRHSVEFARRGLKTTGVDISPYLLERARQYAGEEGLTVEWVQEDMRDFRREESFDLIVNLFTSFGYFSDPGEDRQVLENIFSSLKPGGCAILDLSGKEIIARNFNSTDSFELKDGTTLIERRKILPGWEQIQNRWTLLQGEKATHYDFSLRLYSARELEALLQKTGFSRIEIFGTLQGAPYDEQARRLILRAEKE